MPIHSWKDGHALSTPPKCELMCKVVGESSVSRNPGEPGSLCSLPGEADAAGAFREVLSESLLSICMSTHLPSGPIIVAPSLIYLFPTPPPHSQDLVLRAGGGSTEINQTQNLPLKNTPNKLERKTGRAREKGWVRKI